MHIRPATPADLPAILAIYNEAVLNSTASWAYEPDTLANRTAWLAAHERDDLAVLVAESPRGEVLGWGSLSAFRQKIGYRFTAENSVYVASTAQGRGVGRALLTALLAAARQRGLHVVIAGMDASNQRSERLHAALGFEKVGHLRQVGYKFDRWLDLLFMQYTIEETP